MKPFLVMVVFGVPAVLILLVLSGDLTLSDPREPPKVPAEEETEPPKPIMSADSPVQQKIFNWEYRHFDPELGVFDWLARGSEAVPGGGGNKYDVVKPRIIFSTFTKTTPLREKTSTTLDAGAGRIEFGKDAFTANLSGGVTIISTDLLAERGATGTKLRTRGLHVRSANRRKGSDAAAAQISTTYPVHMTGPGFKLTAQGGMRGSTELNRVTFGPPIKMDLVTSGSGLFFGRKTARGNRIVKVTGGGPLLARREPRRNVFSMSISGGVTVTDAEISISCDTLDLAFGESGSVEAATASGDIVVREGGEVRLLAGRTEWDAKTGRTVLSGSKKVKFTQGNNVLVARTATLTEDRKRLLLEGGLEAWLEGTLARAGDGAGSFPRQWRVFCEGAEMHLSDDGDSLKSQSVELRPAAGGEVLVRSADGTYRVTGGYVSYNAEKALVEIREKPELRRVTESEWVRSERVWLNLKDGTALFEGNVRASFKASGAAWKFKAGRMRANFELREGEDHPTITSVTLTNPGGRVQLDYAPPDGAEIRLLAERLSWDATTRVAVLDSRDGAQLQRLQQAKDWIEARRITFEPQLKRALFEGGVRAHMEPEPAQAAPAGQAPKVEPPFELTCDKFTLNFDDKYKTESALAEGEVEFTSSSNTLVLNCETARYVRGDRITFEGKARPELTTGANRLSARRIVVHMRRERIVFERKVVGRFDDGKGAQMAMTCSEMVALYNPASGSITQVYFTEEVHIETESARAGKTTLDGEQAVYEVEKALVSLTGDPVMIRRASDKLREKKVVYDLKNRVLITGPTEKGYDWELDPHGWTKKGQ